MARSLIALLLAAAPLASAPRAASAQPPARQGTALVLGTSHYASEQAVPACRGAAEAVAGSLRALGFAVTERQDAGRGEFDAALASFARARAAAPDAPAVVYVCGLALEWNSRAFLLPATAALTRDSDTLTQGILARNAADAASRNGTGPSLTLLDLTPRPGGTLNAAGFAAAAETALAADAGLVVAASPATNLPVTPLAAALRAELAGPAVELTALIAALRTRLPEAARLAVVAPKIPRHLAGGPPPALPAAPTPPVAAAPAPAAPSPPASAPAALTPPPAPPEENALTEVQRRRIQAALGVLGHYNGRVDGIFGAESRAAVRRYQSSAEAEPTGRLTAQQIGALLGHAP
jgi:hypothetical protein